MSALSRFEGFMQELMDRRVVRFLGGGLEPAELAKRIGRFLEDHRQMSPAGAIAPDHIVVNVSERDWQGLASLDPAIEAKLTDYAVEFAREREFNFLAAPKVELRASPSVPDGQPEVSGHPNGEVGQARVAAWLETAGAGRPSRLPVSRFPFRIGRQEGNDLTLADERVSRRHAVIDRSDGGFVLQDLNSRNGTKVNGKPVTHSPLRHGDRIAICSVELVFRVVRP